MAQIWEKPDNDPDPDLSPAPIFQAVGEALTQWETLEAHLAAFYKFFVDPSEIWRPELYQAYGSDKRFESRLDNLSEVSHHYFRSHPSQSLEGEFDGLKETTLRVAQRRHEIAHGVVAPGNSLRRVTPDEDIYVGSTYLLMSPLHAILRSRDGNYHYGSAAILAARDNFKTLTQMWVAYAGKLPSPSLTKLWLPTPGPGPV